MDGISNFCAAVDKSLKSGVNLHCTFKVEFRTDLFNFLFDGKGRHPPRRLGQLYELQDFDNRYFKTNWFRCYDKLGNGCEIDFPVRLYSKITWSALVYEKLSNGQVQPKPQSYQEFIFVTLVKKRCA